MDALTEEETYRAVTELEESALRIRSRIVAAQGKHLHVKETAVRKAVQDSMRAGLGVRGANNIIAERLKELSYEAWVHEADDIFFNEDYENT